MSGKAFLKIYSKENILSFCNVYITKHWPMYLCNYLLTGTTNVFSIQFQSTNYSIHC